MKIYAELIGNYKNYRIKSLQDNKLMALLADEELQGVVPKTVEIQQDYQQEIGYYIDENGYKRWGVIPNKQSNNIIINNNFNSYEHIGLRTSNTRLLEGYL